MATAPAPGRSSYVNASKNPFYCHGCGQGGDLIRFVERFRHLSFRQSVAHLEQELAAVARSQSVSELLAHAAAFYQLELHRHLRGDQAHLQQLLERIAQASKMAA